MIKLSNFVSSISEIALGQNVIWNPSCVQPYRVVQPQVKSWGGTMTQRWQVGFICLNLGIWLPAASDPTRYSGSIYSHWREVGTCQGWHISASVGCPLWDRGMAMGQGLAPSKPALWQWVWRFGWGGWRQPRLWSSAAIGWPAVTKTVAFSSHHVEIQPGQTANQEFSGVVRRRLTAKLREGCHVMEVACWYAYGL